MRSVRKAVDIYYPMKDIVNIVTTLLRTPNTGDEGKASALPEPVNSNY